MRRALHRACWVVLLSLPLASGFAAAPEKGPRSVLTDVAALDKRVTYTELKIPLGELVQKVAADTGAPLTAARDVADEPVAVVVKELPARELLEQLADLLDYRWSRREVGQAVSLPGGEDRQADSLPHYEIWQDLPSKQREEALRQAAVRDVEQRFQEELKRYLEVAAMPPEQIQALAGFLQQQIKELANRSPEERQAIMSTPEMREKLKRSGAARQLTSSVSRTLAGLVGRLTPQQWTLLREGRALTLSTDPQQGELRLPEEAARTFKASQPVMNPPGMSFRSANPNEEEQERRQEKRMQEQWSAATGYQVSLRVNAAAARNRGAMSLFSYAGPLRSGSPGSPGAGSFFGGMGTSFIVLAGPVDLQPPSQEDTTRRREEMEMDPVVGVKLPFKPDAKPQVDPFGSVGHPLWRPFDLLPDLARTYDVQIIADAYTLDTGYSGLPATSAPTALFTQLDYCALSSHHWDHRGRLIRIRSRTWFLDRPREIPLRFVREWKALQAQHGALSLDDDVKIATTLTNAQLDGLMGSEELRSLNLDEVPRARHALRLYATFTPTQRQQLWRGGVLPVSQMTPLQRNHFLASLQESNRGRVPQMNLDQWAGGSFSLSGERFIRIVEKIGGSTRIRMEPVDLPPSARGAGPVGAPGAGPVQRVAAATQSTAAKGAPAGGSPLPPQPVAPPNATDSGARLPVTRVELKLQYAPEQVERVTLTVAEQLGGGLR